MADDEIGENCGEGRGEKEPLTRSGTVLQDNNSIAKAKSALWFVRGHDKAGGIAPPAFAAVDT
jgi:hypothetical protein